MRHIKLNFSANNLSTICWWINASHAIYKDYRGHTGEMMSLGKGAAISFSNKQNSTQKAPRNQNLLALTKPCPQSCTQDTSLKPRATLSNKTFYSKTINLRCISKTADHSPAPNAPNTSNVATSSAIKLLMAILRFCTALLKLCGPMFSLNPNKVDPSAMTEATLYECPHQL
jgi:hypothetical protein